MPVIRFNKEAGAADAGRASRQHALSETVSRRRGELSGAAKRKLRAVAPKNHDVFKTDSESGPGGIPGSIEKIMPSSRIVSEVAVM
ncbi:hypothetical protein [Sinorhizobium medicae]|uniref:hypothetical protein n=1 Tax=Sinorhizobium medicae TaxID=110321 RepID=UPI001304A9B6|nr:hypothetical protein [Sinorhizobium medicae]MDX0693001.1 hypothetical protein [Sinorhizobium medicae]MDX0712416.1 hypothetical protein [Sinorhizobium medicae]MDX0744238.1 hypothetical protein [Sinorhizobium medicae]MDX0767784.1 hypothetical protein [Sinorhizobium medicae]MDX0841366.1 hypothetical protein [Sinorhizobium medicae]